MTTINTLFDISHHNPVKFDEVKAGGMLGLIHKATQSNTFEDSTFAPRGKEALEKGLLFGAYHFGSDVDVASQVKFFMGVIAKVKGQVLPCLDWEPNPTPGQGTMSLAQAEEFVTLFHKETGKFPTIYGGYWMIDQLKGKTSAILGQCPLWQAYYKTPLDWPKETWKDWTLWQFTDGQTGPEPHTIPGVGPADRDSFNGDESQLQAFWKANSVSL